MYHLVESIVIQFYTIVQDHCIVITKYQNTIDREKTTIKNIELVRVLLVRRKAI
jgi:hypothetical protein